MSAEQIRTDDVIASDWGNEEERLRLRGEWRDPITLGRMDRLGLDGGWRCLEGGTDLAPWYAMTIDAVRPGFSATGVVTEEDLDAVIAGLSGGAGLLEPGLTSVGVWRRKPR